LAFDEKWGIIVKQDEDCRNLGKRNSDLPTDKTGTITEIENEFGEEFSP